MNARLLLMKNGVWHESEHACESACLLPVSIRFWYESERLYLLLLDRGDCPGLLQLENWTRFDMPGRDAVINGLAGRVFQGLRPAAGCSGAEMGRGQSFSGSFR